MRKPALYAALILVFLGSAVHLRAFQLPDSYAGSTLTVCNKGTVPAEVVVAIEDEYLPMQRMWDVKGTTIAPQVCKKVYDRNNGNQFQPSAYIAFGFADSKGEWGAGKVSHVPDLGTSNMVGLSNIVNGFRDTKTLAAGAKPLCVRKDETRYNILSELPVDCPNFRLANSDFQSVGHGPFVLLTSSLYFTGSSERCYSLQNPCNISAYYLNISPTATDRELRAARGTASGADDAGDNASAAQFFQALDKLWKEEQQREAKAKAEVEAAQGRKLREQAAAREEKKKQILAADAAGDPNVKVEAQMIRRDEEDSRQRWAGTRQSPAAYASGWTGQNMVIVGTVSRVEVDAKGSPQWVTIYFKESPDATFVVCSPYADLFQERVGMNLTALVGKTMEAAGPVESPYCGPKTSKGSIRVVESKQWQVR